MSTEANPKSKAPATEETPEFVETTAPGWMELRPEPEQVVKISKKVGAFLIGLAIVLCAVLAYSGISRQRQRTAAGLNGPQRKVEPARPDDVQQGLILSAPAPNGPRIKTDTVSSAADPVQLQQ